MPRSKQIHAVFGSDEARVKEEALHLARELTPPENAEFGLEIISGHADNSDHAANLIRETVAALQTLPFFGGGKTVWLQSANFLGDDATGRAKATLDALASLQATLEAGLPPDVHLVLSATSVDKRRAFYKKLGQLAKVTVHDLPDPSSSQWENEIAGLVEARAARHRLQLAPDALDYFIVLAGENTRQIDAELEKLALYLGEPGAEATVADVRQIVSRSRAGIIFDIGDAIGERDLPRALDLINQQLRRGENAIGILLAAIAPKIRGLLLARDLMEQHRVRPKGNPRFAYKDYQAQISRLPKSATAHLPRKKDGTVNAYPVFLAARQCQRFSASELEEAVHDCLAANLRLVTSPLAPQTVLFHLVTSILDPSARPPKLSDEALVT